MGSQDCWLIPFKCFQWDGELEVFLTCYKRLLEHTRQSIIHIAWAWWKGTTKTVFAKVLWVCSKQSSLCCWPPDNEKQFLACFPKETEVYSIGMARQTQLQYKWQERMSSWVATIKSNEQMSAHTLADTKWAMNRMPLALTCLPFCKGRVYICISAPYIPQ